MTLPDYGLAIKASIIAEELHRGQERKYTGDPYIVHPMRVGGKVYNHQIASPVTVAAAYLHDTLEDTKYTGEKMLEEFGPDVVCLVIELTNTSKSTGLSRPGRKSLDRLRLRKVSHEARIIKMIDRIDNLGDMSEADEKFKRIYAEESVLLAEAIGDADTELYGELRKITDIRLSECE